MLRGNRGILCALGGLALAGATYADAKGAGEQPQAHQPVAASLERIAASYDDAAKLAESAEELEALCGPGEYGSKADLCAQWKAADAAANSAWWAWAGGIIGLGSLVGIFAAIGLAYHSNWIARDTAKRQLRAYLNITSLNGNPFGVGTTVAAHLTVTNSGQTPAHDVITNVSLCKRMNPVDLNSLVLEPLETSASKLVVAAGQPIFSFAEIAATSQAEFDAFHAGQSSYFVYGHIQYRDVFGEKWVTLFRHSLKANGSWEVCAEGNDAT